MTWKPHCACLFVHGLLLEYSKERGFYMTIRMVLSNKKRKKNMHCSASCDVSTRMPLIPPQCSTQTHKHTCTHTHLRNYCPIIPIPHTHKGSNDKGANTNLLTQGCYYQPVIQMLCKLTFVQKLGTGKDLGFTSVTTGQQVFVTSEDLSWIRFSFTDPKLGNSTFAGLKILQK